MGWGGWVGSVLFVLFLTLSVYVTRFFSPLVPLEGFPRFFLWVGGGTEKLHLCRRLEIPELRTTTAQ